MLWCSGICVYWSLNNDLDVCVMDKYEISINNDSKKKDSLCQINERLKEISRLLEKQTFILERLLWVGQFFQYTYLAIASAVLIVLIVSMLR